MLLTVRIIFHHAHVLCSSIVTNVLLVLSITSVGDHHHEMCYRERGYRRNTTVASCLIDGRKHRLVNQGRRVS